MLTLAALFIVTGLMPRDTPSCAFFYPVGKKECLGIIPRLKWLQ